MPLMMDGNERIEANMTITPLPEHEQLVARALAQFDREEFLSPEQSQGGLGSGPFLRMNSASFRAKDIAAKI